jgi:polyhydroxyalkanoate synthesis regulator phasin
MAEPKSSSQGTGLADALRRYVDAMVGVTEVSRERAEKIMTELAQRGETRAKDLQKAARELADRSSKNRNELVRLVQKEIRRQVSALGLASNDDVEKLKSRIKELERPETSGTPKSAKPPSSIKSRKSTSSSPRTKKQGS